MKQQLFYFLAILVLFSCNDNQQKSQKTSSNDPVKDIDGNVYKTVKIGNQWWMAENLKVTHYRNGDEIPNHSDEDEWDSRTGAYCNYQNDPANGEIYGKLYNWFAVTDSRNIAPEGWHVPTDVEWQEMVDYLGGDTLAGGKLKSTGTIEGGDGLWIKSNEGATNESGFSALPGGYRYSHGFYDSMGSTPYFWTSTESAGGTAWHRYLYYGNTTVYRFNGAWRQTGLSVRCLKD